MLDVIAQSMKRILLAAALGKGRNIPNDIVSSSDLKFVCYASQAFFSHSFFSLALAAPQH
jgi:hypothetical protein